MLVIFFILNKLIIHIRSSVLVNRMEKKGLPGPIVHCTTYFLRSTLLVSFSFCTSIKLWFSISISIIDVVGLGEDLQLRIEIDEESAFGLFAR